MRIHSINLKNFTSFQGEHQIDLDHLLNGEELFAITGPTGSGKSSLLHAVTLALYGKAKDGLNQEDYVTTGEREGRVILKFSVKNEIYTATWNCSISAKSGKPTYKKIIQNLTGPVADKIEDIIELDYGQFTKTVILNQGKFSDFLTSSFTKRKEILEKFYQTDHISKLSPTLKDKIKKTDERLKIIAASIESIGDTSPDLVASLSADKEKMGTDLVNLEKKSKLVKALKDTVKDLRDNRQKLKETKEKLTELNEESKKLTLSFTDNTRKLEATRENKEQHELESARRIPALKDILKKEEEIKLLRQKDEFLEKQIKESDIKTLSLIEKESTLLNLAKLENEKLTATANNRNFKDLNKSELFELEKNFNKEKEIERTLSLHQKRAKELRVEIEQQSASLLSLQESIRALETTPFKNSELSKKDELTALIHQARVALDKNSKVRFEEEQLKKQVADLLLQENESSLKIQTLLLETESLNKLIFDEESFLKKLALGDLAEAINKCRAELKESDSCPVCLSALKGREIPQLLEQVSSAEKEEHKQKKDSFLLHQKRLHESHFQIESLTAMRSDIAAKISNIKDNLLLKVSENHFDRVQEELSALIIKHETDLKNEEAKEQKKELLKAQLIEKEGLKYKTLGALKPLEDEIEKIERESKERQGIINKLVKNSTHELDHALIKNEIECFHNEEKLTLSIKHLTKELLGIKEGQQTEEEKLLLAKKEREKLKALISNIYAGIPTEFHHTNIEAILLKIENDGKNLQKEFEHIQKEVHEVELSKNSIDQKIKDQHWQGEDLNRLAVQYIHIIKGHLSLLEMFQIEDEILKKITAIEFGEEISNHLELISHYHDVGLTSLLSSIEGELSELRLRMGAITAELANLIKLEEKAKILKTERDHLLIQSQNEKKLFEVLGHDDFKGYILSLLEERLLLFANHELAKLCDGRYQLYLEDREYFIVDGQKGSEKRKVNSLSGGETFLVSLALALGLSELSRGNAVIDSFFIDEGFGTLDEEHIDEVLQTLTNVRNRGKQIGVISHVKLLTDRIPVNITIEKKSLEGVSAIGVVYN